MRDPSRARDLADQGVELVPGDLANRQSLDTLLEDTTAVIHCAGSVRGNSQRAFDHTNVDGLAALLDATSSMLRPPRFIFLSSLAAREPGLSWYAQSKRSGEQRLRATANLDSVILRPPPVYGPGDREMLPLFRLMKRGIALVAGTPEGRISLLHVDDLIEAILGCLDTPRLPITAFTPTDPRQQGYNWHEMAAIAENLWQRPVRLLQPPSGLLSAVANGNLALSWALGYAPMLTPPKLRELRHDDWVASSVELSQATGWTPQIDLETGLSELDKTVL